MAGMEIHDSRTTVAGGRERQTASLKILNVQKLLGQEPTRSRVVPPPAGVTGDLKTMEQQDPSLSSQTITVKATRIAAMTHDPPKRFMEIDKNLIIINGDIFQHLAPETMLLGANASYTSAKVGHPGKRRRPSRALRLPASESSWHTPAAPFHTP